MIETLKALFSEEGFMPHIHCYLDRPALVWTMFWSNLLIGIAYFSISITLWVLVRKIKIPFNTIVLCFGIFIGACGLTHLLEVWTLWHPDYWVSAAVSVLTAAASVGTGIYLYRLRHSIVTVAEAAKLSEQRRLDLEAFTKTLEQRVRERSAELRFIADALPTFIAKLDRENRYVFVNAAYAKAFRLEPAQLLGRHVREIVGEEFYARAEPLMKRALQGEQIKYDNSLRTASGEIRDLELHYIPDLSSPGEVKGYIVLAHDITERKKAREELERVHHEVRTAAERVQLALAAGAIAGTWDWDLQSGNITVDERFAENFGIDPSLGQTGLTYEQVIATVHREDLPALRTAITEAIARGGAYSHEYRVRGRDGVYRWIEANGRVEHAPDGTPTRFPGVLLDVEQRRKLETERDRATQLLRAFVDAVPGVVYAKDREGRMLVANRGVTELVGKPPEVYLGKTDLEFLDRKDQALAVMQTDRRIMESGVAETLEEEVNFPDGRRTIWLSTKAPFRDANGKVIGLIGSSIDITARKEADAALTETKMHLERAVSARDEFLSIASHELKTPISSLKLQAQMAKRSRDRGDPNTYSPERVNILIDQTDRQAQRLTRLVDDMLDISRIQAGKLRIQKEPVAVCPLVGEVIERLAPNLREIGTQATCECESALEVEGDRFRIEQVMTNLLTNAMRYGKRKPIHVRVSRSEQDPTRVRITVQDQGMGISAEARERIFGRFEREVSASEVSGLGLGLFISRQIVEAHGGTIWAESKGVDQGSTFCVELPILRAGPEQSREGGKSHGQL